ncbi:MAG: hypothetical protein KDA28_09910 [Phycisphaerales bacterium]|nr:hypothetical protein [Phycisphaerales bacterium]
MTPLPPTIWLLMGAVAALAVVAMLYMFASLIRNETHLHDLRVDVANLQSNYLRRMLRLKKGGRWEDVEIVDVNVLDDHADETSESAPSRKAA